MNNWEWMKDVTYDMLTDSQKSIADVIGVEATLKLCEVWGGSRDLYIPKNDVIKRFLRDRQIKKAYAQQGYKVSSLKRQYNLSDRQVQRLIRDARPEQVRLEDLL